jgi:hypothetical protein
LAETLSAFFLVYGIPPDSMTPPVDESVGPEHVDADARTALLRAMRD